MTISIQAGARPAVNPDQASTRHLVVDRKFAAILTEDFGIKSAVILRALDGEPKRQAIALCEWAERTSDPTGALLAWARKHHAGAYHRHGAAAPQPAHNTPGYGRVSGPARTHESLRGVLVDPSRLAGLAERMGV